MNEQSYLNHTLTSLRVAYERLNANITEKDANYKDLQEYMIDYKAELDKFEVYDYQQTLSMIDKQGFRQVMEREQVKKLIESPYFGNFDFQYAGDDEAQRLKLAKELLSVKGQQNLFLIDEPSTGLHPVDIENFIVLLNKMVDDGHSVIVVEHNEQIIRAADYIIELGPEGGDKGGTVIATGTPEQMKHNSNSIIRTFL